jgi:peptide-methionine (S)-S-oxide reductase
MLLLLACLARATDDDRPAPLPPAGPGQAVAVFAGGCFWCMESDFDALAGVVATTSGYAGGKVSNPTYEQVSDETTGHRESVRVVYDTAKLTYDKVLDWYWHHVDPTDGGGQFCDRGDSYRTAIFPVDDAQRKAAEASKAAIDASHVLSGPIVTDIVAGATFWPSEVYHQDFHHKNPMRYKPYRLACGRDARAKAVWAMEKR